MLDTLMRRPPRGMTADEARLAGRIPPEDWVPPRRDRLRDAVRTARVLGGALVQLARDDVPDGGSTTAAGLARVRGGLAAIADALGVRVVVHRADRVPATGGLVFMWNQTSHLDHLVLPLAIPRPFLTTYNNEVRRFPGYGAYLERNHHIWLDRTDEAQWRAAIEQGAARIAAGECVLVSPEGTRSWDGRLLPMKRGAFLLARAARQPIVCVSVRGARELLPRGRFAVRPGTVDIELSEPIPVDTPELETIVARTFRVP